MFYCNIHAFVKKSTYDKKNSSQCYQLISLCNTIVSSIIHCLTIYEVSESILSNELIRYIIIIQVKYSWFAQQCLINHSARPFFSFWCNYFFVFMKNCSLCISNNQSFIILISRWFTDIQYICIVDLLNS